MNGLSDDKIDELLVPKVKVLSPEEIDRLLTPMNFAHLHVHSDYSLYESTASVKALVDRAEELGMTHLALTDSGNMFGIMDFVEACKNRGKPIKPIIGCEMYIAAAEDKDYHLVLLATNLEGYYNLTKLCSLAYTEGYYNHPRVDNGFLSKYHTGIIALSGGFSGEIPQLILCGKIAEAEQKAVYYRDLFGTDEQGRPNFYLEIQDHGMSSQLEINIEMLAISGRTGIPLVATNDVHYINRQDFFAHDVLLCIGTNKNIYEYNRKKYFGEHFYFKNHVEMSELFKDYSEAVANTLLIAERCVFDIPKVEAKDLSAYLPDFEIHGSFKNADEYLRHLAYEGLAARYPKEKAANGKEWEDIQTKAEHELDVIIKNNFSNYFLIIADIVNWAIKHDIPVGPGRSSSTGSIVNYALRITNIDPIKYKLVFERFIKPESVKMPDIDIDFSNEGREKVINYIAEKYGRERVGRIIHLTTLNARTVIKEVARVFGVPAPEASMLADLIPVNPRIPLQSAIEETPKLQELANDTRFKELFSIARKLEGLHRSPSFNAAGIVISKTTLIDLAPLYKDYPDCNTGREIDIAVQYNTEHLEKIGLVKIDLLSHKYLDIIKRTEKLIRGRGGEYADFSVKNVGDDDEATFKMLCEGDGSCVFQFEGETKQDMLRQVQPKNIEDLIRIASFYWPGPLDTFNRNHAASYSLLAYHSAYLKANFPKEFEEGIKHEYF
jgi:DNA polymerase-3 subunit alpha